MEAHLLKNETGNIGIAVMDEPRKIKTITYDVLERRLIIHFVNGETEKLTTELDALFNRDLLTNKQIHVAHFKDGRFDEDPCEEYFVRLEV